MNFLDDRNEDFAQYEFLKCIRYNCYLICGREENSVILMNSIYLCGVMNFAELTVKGE